MKKNFISVVCVALFSVAGLFATQISANDKSDGWASFAGTKDLSGNAVVPPSAYGTNGGEGASVVLTVTNREELLSALKQGDRRIIYVKGIIDMTDTGSGSLLPETVNGSTAQMDKLLKEKNSRNCSSCKFLQRMERKIHCKL